MNGETAAMIAVIDYESIFSAAAHLSQESHEQEINCLTGRHLNIGTRNDVDRLQDADAKLGSFVSTLEEQSVSERTRYHRNPIPEGVAQKRMESGTRGDCVCSRNGTLELSASDSNQTMAAEQDEPNPVREGVGSPAGRRSPANLRSLSINEFRNGANVSTSEFAEEAAKKKHLDLVTEVMSCLGPSGPGLLAVRGMPAVDELRRQLLPLAKKLALMPDRNRRAAVLKEQGLSTDVPMKNPHRPVSAFATQLRYSRHSHTDDGFCLLHTQKNSSPGCLVDVLRPSKENVSKGNHDDFVQLGNVLRQLGACMVEVGLLVARICDSAIPYAKLEDSMWESGSAKARLIHYHADKEKDLLSQSSMMEKGFKRKGKKLSSTVSAELRPEDDRTKSLWHETDPSLMNSSSISCTSTNGIVNGVSELWQQWHYDYGILTVLTAPMFLPSSSSGLPTQGSSKDCNYYPGGHTGLRIISSAMNGFVRVPPDCLLVQIGEAAQIASGGKLAATAHCVSRLPDPDESDISRETFVTFLQPPWHKVLSTPMGVTRQKVLHPRPVGHFQFASPTEKGVDLELRMANGDCSVEVTEFPSPPGEANVLVNSESPQELGPSVKKEENLIGCLVEREADHLSYQYAKLLSVVPALASRWRDGCTFAEFSKETTSKYYGAHGQQSQKDR